MRYRIIVSAAFLLTLWAHAACAAPKAKLWDRWTAHDASSTISVDHTAWDGFLKAYVKESSDGVNRVAYADVSAEDGAALDAYLENLSSVAVSRLNRAEQRAFWINLYNALTVNVILDHYPVESIRDIDISPGFFSDGPWGRKLISIEGTEVSLDDIEHRILRPIWKDPRIHYAVNCASIGCPNLQRDAYAAADTDELLERGARAYVNHPRGVTVERGRLTASSIYVWFQADFGGTDRGVIEHLSTYAEPPLRQQLQDVRKISDDVYDWTLNQTR